MWLITLPKNASHSAHPIQLSLTGLIWIKNCVLLNAQITTMDTIVAWSARLNVGMILLLLGQINMLMSNSRYVLWCALPILSQPSAKMILIHVWRLDTVLERLGHKLRSMIGCVCHTVLPLEKEMAICGSMLII